MNTPRVSKKVSLPELVKPKGIETLMDKYECAYNIKGAERDDCKCYNCESLQRFMPAVTKGIMTESDVIIRMSYYTLRYSDLVEPEKLNFTSYEF